MKKWIDSIAEKSARAVARRTSRRSFVASVGSMLTGAALLPLLPFDRSNRAQGAEPPPTKPTDDPQSCEYWKYCALDGFLCSCCGGSSHTCPAGTTPSPITWIGTCHNPVDARDYIVSYNDCCGKPSCGQCTCNRNENEKPIYRAARNNDLNWCMANKDVSYHCSVSVVLGVSQP
jgi:methylamine dehydrogenase light chain